MDLFESGSMLSRYRSSSFPLMYEMMLDDHLDNFAMLLALLFDSDDSDDSSLSEEDSEEEEYDSDRQCTKKPLDLTWLFKQPDDEFRLATRTNKTSFLWIFNQIKDNPTFRREGAPQLSIVQQLAITLEILGSNGHHAPVGPLARKLGLTRREAIKAIHGPIQAIVALGPKYVIWPNQARRRLISNTMKNKGFEGCVGSLDDITIPVSYPPGDEAFLSSHSGTYSINAQIVCDSSNRITAFFSGWPGDWRGSLSYEKTLLHRTPKKYFDPGQYLIADSAYRPSQTVIPPSNPPGPKTKTDEEFDYCLAKAHEHSMKTIGALTSRWASLKEIRYTRSAGVKHYIQWIHCCTILYNMLEQFGDSWDPPHPPDTPQRPPIASPPTVRNTRTLDAFRSTVKAKCIDVNYRSGSLPIPP